MAATVSVTITDVNERAGPEAKAALISAARSVLAMELVDLHDFDFSRYRGVLLPQVVSIFSGYYLICHQLGELVPSSTAGSLLRFAIELPAPASPIEVQVRGRV